MKEILEGLNPQQREAVMATEGYVRVFAGPGTGKTATLARRYAYIVSALGAPPRCVLCVTFTNKAASEMKKRILGLTGDGIAPFVRTFHALCCDFLRDEAKAVGIPSGFTLYDVDDVKDTLREIYVSNGIDGRDFTLDDAWDYIDLIKSTRLEYTDNLLLKDSGELLKLACEQPSLKDRLLYLYMYEQRTACALDFDDLIALALRILKDREDIRQRWQERLEYIMVDEFQDIDALQYELVELLSDHHHNLFIVGDPDQTIYTFRGADVRFFTNFPLRHKECKIIALELNYRSTPEILRAAYTLISRNPDPGRVAPKAALKTPDEFMVKIARPVSAEDASLDAGSLIKMMDKGALTKATLNLPQKKADDVFSRLPVVAFSATPDLEAEYIASMLCRIKERFPDTTQAVLYRAHHVSAPIERALIRHKLPYRILSGTGFFGRQEIRTALSYVRLCVNENDDASFRRAIAEPRRGFGKKRLESLKKRSSQSGHGMFGCLCAIADGNPKDPILKGTRAFEFVQIMRALTKMTAHMSPSMALEHILNDSGYEEYLKVTGQKDRLEGLAALRSMARDYEITEGERTLIADFVRDTALYSEQDRKSRREEVKLLTAHGAKGLEFDYVFIAGLCEGTFPSGKSQNAEGVEEERRLMYVAMTRARRQLFMCLARAFSGSEVQREPSRFLRELTKAEVLELGGSVAGTAGGAKGGAEPLFKPGDRVFHSILGPGVVLETDRKLGEYRVRFDSIKQPRSLSFTSPLESEDRASFSNNADLEQ